MVTRGTLAPIILLFVCALDNLFVGKELRLDPTVDKITCRIRPVAASMSKIG